MTVAEFFKLDNKEIFQTGIIFINDVKCKYAFIKGHGQDWAGYYQSIDDEKDVTKFGNKMTFTLAKKLCPKSIINLYRL